MIRHRDYLKSDPSSIELLSDMRTCVANTIRLWLRSQKKRNNNLSLDHDAVTALLNHMMANIRNSGSASVFAHFATHSFPFLDLDRLKLIFERGKKYQQCQSGKKVSKSFSAQARTPTSSCGELKLVYACAFLMRATIELARKWEKSFWAIESENNSRDLLKVSSKAWRRILMEDWRNFLLFGVSHIEWHEIMCADGCWGMFYGEEEEFNSFACEKLSFPLLIPLSFILGTFFSLIEAGGCLGERWNKSVILNFKKNYKVMKLN